MLKRQRSGATMVLLVSLLAIATTAHAGGPLGGDRFPIYNGAGISEIEAAGAYNSQRQEYLAVWEGGGIWGRLLAAHGAPIGAAFQISPDAASANPDVAYSSAADEYLVVWQTDVSVQGQRLSAAGALQGAVIPIGTGYLPPPGSDGYYCDQPTVAYASTSDRYLVAYRYRHDADDGSSIRARSYLSDGAPEAVSFEVGPYNATMLPQQPDVAYNRSRNELLVVWQKFFGGDVDVYGRRVKMTGGADVLDSEFPIANMLADDEMYPAVAAIPTVADEGQYLVAWERNANILACTVNGTGTIGIWRTLADTGWGEHRPAVAGSESSDQFLVTWTWVPVVTPPAMMQVQARTLALDGTILDDTVLVGGGQVFDSAAVAGPTGDVLVLLDDNETFGTSSRGIYGRLWGNRTYVPLVVR